MPHEERPNTSVTASDPHLYWEDFIVGEATDFGETVVTAEEIIAFALEFDPDPAHLGEAPDDADFTASDWHSCAMLMRMMCDDYLKNAAGIGAPGVEHVRWFGSVRPGDVLRSRRTPIETRASKSRPGVGIVRMFQEVFNQDGEIVLTWLPIQLYERRDCSAKPPLPAVSAGPTSMNHAMRKPPNLPTDDLRRPVGVFEDFEIGDTIDLGSHVFSKDEMLSYARRFNPQYFHADEEAAKASLYGGLIASGWHTGAVWNRHLVTHRENLAEEPDCRTARSLSIAVADMTWSGPVRPGDELAFRTKVAGRSALPELPQWGLVESFDEGINQRGETVLSLRHRYWSERAQP
jgi:acyl dehydratase